MAVWRNADGLDIKFGTEKGASAHDAGDYKTFNRGESILEIELDLTKLTTAEVILNDVVYLPSLAQITWVETIAEVVGATGTSIDVGLIRDDRTTEEDYDGLLAAFPLSGNYDGLGDTVTFRENATIPASVTGTGALIGTILSDANSERFYLSASYAAGSAFTTGVLKIRIGYIPNAVAN